jgi:excisionase family DNA binding protein
MSFAEAAKFLAVSLRQVRRLVDSGKLRCVVVSARCPRIRQSDLETYLESVTVDRGMPV